MYTVTRYPAKRALSLAEAVVGLFVLTCGILASFQFLQLSTRYGTWVSQRLLATRLAQRHLAEIRAWARQKNASGAFNFDVSAAWATYDLAWAPDPLDGDFQLRIRNQAQTVFSPNSSLESAYEDWRQKQMLQSFRRVQVDVAWQGRTQSMVTLVSLVGAPERQAKGLVLTQTSRFQSPPLEYKERVEFEAELWDVTDRKIPDVMFSHYVRSYADGSQRAGNGVLDNSVSPRNGKTATLYHQYPGFGRNWFSAYGQVKLQCIARYRGLQYGDTSGFMRLKK